MSQLFTTLRGLSEQKRRRFVRHYLEMVLVMLLGMMAFAPVWELASRALAWPGLVDRADLRVVAMATDMTVAMSLFMWVRGHRWKPILEMGAAMSAPFLLLLGPLYAGLLTENGVLGLGHLLMLLAMAITMLVRPDEYTHGHGEADSTPAETLTARGATADV